MSINLLKGEIFNNSKNDLKITKTSASEINTKYIEGEVRIVTEQARYPLHSLNQLFKDSKYELHPEFQRRRRWSNAKKSKLIESFIINVPVPPVFLYEIDYASYEVMDGLQRITSIIDFYNDEYSLESLEEWSELNGMLYSQLPEKIKEGIDRRYLSSVILVKESAKTDLQADKLKKLVFERLNSGGVKLSYQETRNALYDGKMNLLCIKLSKNSVYQKLWNISALEDNQLDIEDVEMDDLSQSDEVLGIRNNKLYKDMSDVELVLRFFAFRSIDKYNGGLNTFLDRFLKVSNSFSDEIMNTYETLFEQVVYLADKIFGDCVFKQFKLSRGNYNWSDPQRTIFDPMMLTLQEVLSENYDFDDNLEDRILKLGEFYKLHQDDFNGKKQSKNDIVARKELFIELISTIKKG